MHILITNDDGPPSSKSSPYVHSFIAHLKRAGHAVSVCLPNTQRSWIGKAHMIGQTLKPSYYRPSPNIHGDDTEGTTSALPDLSGEGEEEWILVDGTPASCVQIGLNHFFQDKGPVDLVVSGPNYGRNTTAIFALSSGTLGAALEAAGCKFKSVAVSFAFFSRNHDPAIIDAACRQAIKVIDGLCRQWPTDGSVDLYSVNVPLVEAVDTHKTYLTRMLQNYWQAGGCFEEIDDPSAAAADPIDEEAKIREGQAASPTEGTGASRVGHKHKHFKWAPRFADVYNSVEEAGPGSDGWVVKEGHTSVTPLKASFAQTDFGSSQVELHFTEASEQADRKELAIGEERRDGRGSDKIQAFVAYDDDYVQPLILSALKSLLSDDQLDLITDVPRSHDGAFSASQAVSSSPHSKVLQILPYESLDFDYASSHTDSCLVNSYTIRKALIRKHYLSTTVEHWVAKNPDSVLRTHVKRSEAFEVDYAEFLDDALVEAFDLGASFARNAALDEEAAPAPEKREWWILKPGMSDRGQGIRLFSTMDELQAIFDGWEAARPDSDDEVEDAEGETTARCGGGGGGDDERSDYITASHLRHFVAQPYIHPPLLLGDDGRKFHVRTYVLCVGSVKVYVYRPMLALFAAKPYRAPWEADGGDDAARFLTNTCLQDQSARMTTMTTTTTVRPFWSLENGEGGGAFSADDVFGQICAVAGDVVEAAARTMPVHFQPRPNAFEALGLDFLVDAAGRAWLLEVNAFPDFAQTGRGEDVAGIVAGFWRAVVRVAVVPFFAGGGGDGGGDGEESDLVCVRDVDLGRR